MPGYKNWWAFYGALLQHFGKECRKTWGREMTVAILGGLSAAFTGFLRSHGKQSLLDAIIDGLIGALIFFSLYAFGLLLSTPWREHQQKDYGLSKANGVFGVVICLFLLSELGVGFWLVKSDLTSQITLSAPADPGQIKALEDCKGNLAALTKPEPKDSLRRRTIKLVDDLISFWVQRPYPQQRVQNPTTDEERKTNDQWDGYWRKANADYKNRDFNQRVLGIVREYKQKGIPTGFIEQGAEQPDRLIGSGPFGGYALDNCDKYLSGICQLRDLAFHVNAEDKRIDPPDF